QHPELGFHEVRTAARLARELRDAGFQVTEKVGGTGVVGLYRNGPGPVVMIRTELDALPMQEKTGLPYASQATASYAGHETPVAHSCGHDIHMAAWVGVARTLVEMKTRWSGTLMFVAQPSEEDDSGADAMLKDGLFQRFAKPDFALALHTGPFAYGMVGYRAGPIMSAEDTLTVRFIGRGGHGSSPHATIDPILMASRFVVDVQGVVSREKDPKAFGVVTIGAVDAGSAGNIIPDSATLRGTIRSYDDSVRGPLLAGVRRTAMAEAAMSGAPAPDIEIRHDADPVVNDAALAERLGGVFRAAFGPMAIVMDPAPASEDFGRYAREGVKTHYFFIGVYEPKRFFDSLRSGEPLPSNHSPLFAPVPEPTIKTGVTAMALAALELLTPAPSER
ncbi:MAG TPA: amidohydrolase, partial [Caulobacteraceae bacterium]|nr:amidohydrolase [Caulobacteraceae bacterium]